VPCLQKNPSVDFDSHYKGLILLSSCQLSIYIYISVAVESCFHCGPIPQPNNPKLLLIFNFRKSLYFYYMYMQLVIKEGITATFLNHIPRNLKKTSYFVALWKLFLNHLHIIPVKFGLKWENFISYKQKFGIIGLNHLLIQLTGYW
jgi:hypothetical protein